MGCVISFPDFIVGVYKNKWIQLWEKIKSLLPTAVYFNYK